MIYYLYLDYKYDLQIKDKMLKIQSFQSIYCYRISKKFDLDLAIDESKENKKL
jgi:hypothetical protein